MNADIVQRFEREAQAAGRIGNDHILEVLDLGAADVEPRDQVLVEALAGVVRSGFEFEGERWDHGSFQAPYRGAIRNGHQSIRGNAGLFSGVLRTLATESR